MSSPEIVQASAADAEAGSIPVPGCAATDSIGRSCVLVAGHDGAHGVQMDQHELVCRQAVQACIVHRDRTVGRSRLLSAREVKLDMILDNQAAILNGLAMVIDGMLQDQGLPPEIQILPKSGNGRA